MPAFWGSPRPLNDDTYGPTENVIATLRTYLPPQMTIGR